MWPESSRAASISACSTSSARTSSGELSRAFFRLSQQRQTAEREMAALARTDALTGIANRRMFEEVFALAVRRAARIGNWVGLAYLDIDHFKAINDSRGHAAGDLVLVEFARRLRLAVRATDTVARLAGDEFVVLFDCLDPDGAPEALAHKILDCMRAPFVLGADSVDVTASVGVALAMRQRFARWMRCWARPIRRCTKPSTRAAIPGPCGGWGRQRPCEMVAECADGREHTMKRKLQVALPILAVAAIAVLHPRPTLVVDDGVTFNTQR
ncbi:GGDEF domain-containing protein [Massilia sp. B-10]|nr:GGDEF domain-containing protein [Massilia sp. B-10]